MSDDLKLQTPKFWLPHWLHSRLWPGLVDRTRLTGEARRTWTLIPHVHFHLWIIEVEFGPVEFGAVAYKPEDKK